MIKNDLKMRKVPSQGRSADFSSPRSLAMLWALCCVLCVRATTWASEDADKHETLPSFQELYSLIRSNLTSVSEEELNRAAVFGLLNQLAHQVVLLTNAPSGMEASNSSLVGRTSVFDRAFGYVRLNAVRDGLAHAFARAFAQLRSTNKLSGLVLDLRFTGGDSYAEAVEVADLFFETEQPLLKWGDSIKRSKAKTNVIERPVVVLVNHQTAGAAEALAAVLRGADVSLLVGSPTAGQAQVFKEFALGHGQRIRIAAGRIEVCDGQPLLERGVTPDLMVNVSEEAERLYLDDPYRSLSKIPGQRAKASSPGDGPGSSTSEAASRRRLNESSLIRQSREEAEMDAHDTSASADLPPRSVVQDPALARALDVLKGLALVKNRP